MCRGYFKTFIRLFSYINNINNCISIQILKPMMAVTRILLALRQKRYYHVYNSVVHLENHTMNLVIWTRLCLKFYFLYLL